MDKITKNIDQQNKDERYEIRQQLTFAPAESYLVFEDGSIKKCAERYGDKDYIANIDGIVELFFPSRLSQQDKASEQTNDETKIKSNDNAMGFLSDIGGLGYEESKEKFRNLLQSIYRHVSEFTVVCENYHVDPCYRDSYYSYFAGQHFSVSKFTQRLTFFKGDWRKLEYFSAENEQKLNDDFLGTCILYPTEARTIGRALFNPKYLLEKNRPYYIRLTDYSITVFGIRLSFKAFLFQMQDRETTRCAEVTLLNILDYYGRTYNEYRTCLPSDIIMAEQKLTTDRALPSRGINYYTMSRILTTFGFAPRLYSWEAMHQDENMKNKTNGDSKNDICDNSTSNINNKMNDDWKDLELHRILHYYIESGIPVAINVMERDEEYSLPGHSLVCIGYCGHQTIQNKRNALKHAIPLSKGSKLINAADYYSRYTVIDDNQLPYSTRTFEHLSIHTNLKVGHILIPLYKRMHMEASDAYDVVIAMLQHEDYGIIKRGGELGLDEPIVVRLFLASSRTYRHFRIMHSSEQDSKYRAEYQKIYGMTPFPRFIWVAELFTKENYEDPNGKAFGEIVLDATATTKNDIKSVIILNYSSVISVRYPEQPIEALNFNSKHIMLKPFNRFTGNLASFQ